MKVKELKEILEDFPDNADIWLMVREFDVELVGISYNMGRTYLNLMDHNQEGEC